MQATCCRGALWGLLVLALWGPGSAGPLYAQSGLPVDSSANSHVDSPPVLPLAGSYPQFNSRLDGLLSGRGVALGTVGFIVDDGARAVPPEGLDPGEISLAADRRSLGQGSLDANRWSDWTRDGALAFPLVVGLLAGEAGGGWAAFGRRATVYAEALLVSQSSTVLAKNPLGRARPYAYPPAGARPSHPDYDVARARTFRSLPSGHAYAAWTGAAMGTTEHLLRRTRATGIERFGVGVVAGALAGATAALRITAGEHFPSDVLAGAGLGLFTGTLVPFLHRGAAPNPTARAWLQMTGGLAFGAFLGALAGG
ncbi:MAG: phosphatase PAP2 family protein [Gemmatimonadota bacterium]|nr:phosphatase PAP2 family protein [Gemmatimonadota bacterium]